jgi:hypothetical protein
MDPANDVSHRMCYRSRSGGLINASVVLDESKLAELEGF